MLPEHGRWRRRHRLPPVASLLLATLLGLGASGEENVKIYFGGGCFWHVQHELILVEQAELGRVDGDLTAVSGYAGGASSASPICYGNSGGLGHTEVVQVEIPEGHVEEFANAFWCLFVGKDRIDTMDVGAEYRAALGLPGGMQSPLLSIFGNGSQAGRVAQEFALEGGAGGDPDTLGEALVWVYDSAEFPFYPAEAYHQFHDDFMAGGEYPATYNALRETAQEACRLRPTGCKDDTWDSPASCLDGAAPSGSAGDSGSTSHDQGGSGGGSGGSSSGGMAPDYGSAQHECTAGTSATKVASGSCVVARVTLLIWVMMTVGAVLPG